MGVDLISRYGPTLGASFRGSSCLGFLPTRWLSHFLLLLPKYIRWLEPTVTRGIGSELINITCWHVNSGTNDIETPDPLYDLILPGSHTLVP